MGRLKLDEVAAYVTDLSGAAEWLSGALGWQVVWRSPRTGLPGDDVGLPGETVWREHVVLRPCGTGIWLRLVRHQVHTTDGMWTPEYGTTTLIVQSRDIDAEWRRLQSAGLRDASPPHEITEGRMREGTVFQGFCPGPLALMVIQPPTGAQPARELLQRP